MTTEKPASGTRQHLALALDLDDLDAARDLAGSLSAYFAVVKVGLELFSSAGPKAIAALVGDGFDVFVDLKLHDIPTTVGRAARMLGRAGARYVTVHTAGGRSMIEAGVAGLADEAAGRPCDVLGVTVRTSEPVASPEVLTLRAALAASSGCGGVACAAADLAAARAAAPGLLTVVSGIREVGFDADDQGRPASARDALAAGADLLVIGRTVTASPDPQEAAADLVSSLL